MHDLTQDEWREAMSLLDQVLDLDDDEQQAVLEDSGTPKKIQETVERLLAHDHAADDVLDRGAFSLIAPVVGTDDELTPSTVRALEALSSGDEGLDVRATDLEPGTTVGPYRIERLLGRGGMGEVYLAERDDDTYTQKVALKLVKGRGIGSKEVELRFRRERQILASLRHENVARLLDGGMTEDQRPYLVMEYVDGRSITHFADDHSLGLDARLQLFEQACRAVRYAHRRAIIHRDIKPSNLLVEERGRGDGAAGPAPGAPGGDGQSPPARTSSVETDAPDGERGERPRSARASTPGAAEPRPVVKLLDFGIAKLLETEDGEATLTRDGERLMTPQYAAPEQITGDPITTSTDVYQLGVLLYELLTGQRPFQVDSEGKLGRAKVRAAEDAILGRDPDNPSEVVTRVGDTLRRTHSTDPRRLAGRVKGDLDAIARKALRKEPSARYASVSEMMEDLECYRSGRPVEARQGAWSYRAGKFLRRNRTAVVVGAVFALVVAGFIASLLVQTHRLQEALTEVRAESERRGQVQELFMSMADVTDPNSSYADTLTVGQWLDISQTNVAQRFADAPDLRAWAYGRLAAYEFRGGDFRQAFQLADSAMTIYETEVSEDARYRQYAAEYSRAAQWAGVSLRNLEDIGRAEPLLRKSVEIIERADEMRSQRAGWFGAPIAEESLLPNELRARERYHSVLRRYDVDAAEEQAARILDIVSMYQKGEAPEVTDADVAAALEEVANLRRDKGSYAEADSLYQQVIEIRTRVHGEVSTEVAETIKNVSGMYYRAGDYASSLEKDKKALSIHRSLGSPQSTKLLPYLGNVGQSHYALGNYDRAIDIFKEVLSITQRAFGPGHPHTALEHIRIGAALHRSGNPEKAVSHFETAVDIRERAYGSLSPSTAHARDWLARSLQAAGRTGAAEAQFKTAIDDLRVLYNDPSLVTASNTGQYIDVEGWYLVALSYYAELLRDEEREEDRCQVLAETEPVVVEVHGSESTEADDIRDKLEECDVARR